jgi:hypothetical protein
VKALARRALAPLLVLVFAGLQAAALHCELDCLGESERAAGPTAPAKACAAGHDTPRDAASEPRPDPPAHGEDCDGYLHAGAGAALASAKVPAAKRVPTFAMIVNASAAGVPRASLGQARATGTASSHSPPRARSSSVLRI